MAWATTTFPRAREIPARCASHIVDLSGGEPGDAAIYTLSDPRDVEEVRYVGKTANPRSRFLQHIRAARLWLPDDLPWWIKSPKKRPLYHWIRDLYRDECRLPVMVVIAWVDAEQALLAERAQILERLASGQSLLNQESERAPKRRCRRNPAA
jgi:hypothetical protein